MGIAPLGRPRTRRGCGRLAAVNFIEDVVERSPLAGRR